ncbi:MAG: pyruvate formate-lyase-activating protein [Akkermansia sp.]
MSPIGKIHSRLSAGTVDGPGIRYVVFFQGCPLRCRFCHNPDTWSTKGGEPTSVAELANDILKYRAFFKASGGGITLTGGEPLLQKPYVLELFRELKQHQLHLALDTSGFIDVDEALLEILSLVDLVMLDIKHIDGECHQRLTSVKNDKIKNFLALLNEKGIRTWVRYVLVAGVNDAPEYVQQYVDFVKQFSCVELVEILPYHEMGVHKWEQMKVPYTLSKENIPAAEIIARVNQQFRDHGVNTICP